jgi:hypothetical protein
MIPSSHLISTTIHPSGRVEMRVTNPETGVTVKSCCSKKGKVKTTIESSTNPAAVVAATAAMIGGTSFPKPAYEPQRARPMRILRRPVQKPALQATAPIFIPKSLQTAVQDDRDPAVNAWKNAVAWDLRKLAGLMETIPGLNGRLQIDPAIDEGVSEEEKRRRRALRARLFAPDTRFVGHTVDILRLIRRVYAVKKTDELVEICTDFFQICKEIGISESESDRLVINFDNLYEVLQEVNQIESVIGALDL